VLRGDILMRKFQITVFVIATAALIAAACCMGKEVGGELRKAGMAALLFVVVCILLWPTAKKA
jgi:preprotein translocase subunit SecF